MSYSLRDILEATPSAEPAEFFEFVRALDDPPTKGARDEWRDLFEAIRSAEELGYVEAERAKGNIDSLQLTAEGVACLKDMRSE